MKLKIKHIQQPQQAHRVEVPNGATLEELRSAVLPQLAFSEATAASQVSLSLNKKDAIQGENSSSLASLGICSGDLLWVLAPPVAAAPAPPPTVPEAAAAVASVPAAAAVPQRCVEPTPSAMDIDTPPQLVQQQQQQQQLQEEQQQHPASPADADHAAADNEHLQALQAELASSPAQVWMPDSLAALLCAAGSESRQQQQQQVTLSPAQVLMLTAHAALLECGFAHTPPSTAAAAAAAGAGSSSGSGSAGAAATTDAAQAVLSALKGSRGVFSLSYSLPSGGSAGVCVQLCGLDMGQHLVLIGNLQTPAAAAAAGDASSSSHSRSNSSSSSRMVATLNLSKTQVGPPASTDAAGATSTAPLASTTAGAGAQPPQQQQQQQATLAGYPVCSFQELPKLWVQLKDGLGLPLLMASCAAAGLPPPLGLNSLTYELQEAILGLLEAKDLAALCCSCSPMRHRASTDTLWKPLFDREFPDPAEDQQPQQQDKGAAKAQPQPTAQQQQQQQGGAPTPAARPGVSAAGSSGAAGSSSGSSSTAQALTLPQQPQQQPLHARLQYLLSHGQRYTLRQSLRQLRQEAGRRGWKWAFGAAWMQRGRLLAEAERNRRLGPMPLHVPPHPNPMPWGPFRPRQPMMPPNIIGGDYDRFPNVGGFGFGAGNLPGGLGFSGGGVGPGFMPGGGVGLGSGAGAMFSGGGGGALGQAGPLPAGVRGMGGGGGLGPGGMPGLGGGRRSGNSSSNTRLY